MQLWYDLHGHSLRDAPR
ncbi:hypothetical protein [Pseudomonas aeruginosa]